MEKVIRFRSLHDPSDDLAYWLTRTPQERLDAIEILRSQYIKWKNVEPGLQRVCRITERAPR
jgi:hypothetical protein